MQSIPSNTQIYPGSNQVYQNQTPIQYEVDPY